MQTFRIQPNDCHSGVDPCSAQPAHLCGLQLQEGTGMVQGVEGFPGLSRGSIFLIVRPFFLERELGER